MTYLITQMLLCLLLAFLLGLLLGWLLWGRREERVVVDEACQRDLAAARKEIDELRARLAACEEGRADLEAKLAAAVARAEGLEANLSAAVDRAEGLDVKLGAVGAALGEAKRADELKGTFYDIEVVEGIAEVYGNKLRSIGIPTTKELILRCGPKQSREVVSAELDFREALLLKWTCIADLMRVSGVGEEFSELIEVAGVRSMPELARCNPEALLKEMTRVNEEKNLSRRLPTLAQVEGWKEQAPGLGSVVEFD